MRKERVRRKRSEKEAEWEGNGVRDGSGVRKGRRLRGVEMNGKWNGIGIGRRGAGDRELNGSGLLNMIQSLRYSHMGKAEEGGASGGNKEGRETGGVG